MWFKSIWISVFGFWRNTHYLSFMRTSLFLSRWNSILKADAEQPSSADVGTTCGWLCCMLPCSQPPSCTPVPFCGISCTCATSTPSSVAAFVLPVLITVDHSNGAQIQGIPSPIWLTHPFGTKQRYRYVYDAHPVLWLRKSWHAPRRPHCPDPCT